MKAKKQQRKRDEHEPERAPSLPAVEEASATEGQEAVLQPEAAAHDRNSGRPIGISKIDLETVWGSSGACGRQADGSRHGEM